MEDVLKDPYFGEIRPCDQLDLQEESFKQAGAAYDEAEKRFIAGLTEEQKEAFEQLKYIKNDFDREYDVLNFKKGFQLGMQLTVAGLEKDRLEEKQTEE